MLLTAMLTGFHTPAGGGCNLQKFYYEIERPEQEKHS
jgi:hypothetical protein